MDICIFGDIVNFIYCKAIGEIVLGESQSIDTIISTTGNDAAIVTFVLAKLGKKALFVPLSFVSSKHLHQMETAGISVIDPKIWDPGGKTVLVEDGSGQRTFLSACPPFFDKIRVPKGAEFLYIDFYEEYIDILCQFLNEVEKSECTCLYINLSSSNIIEKAAFLSGYERKPDFIQFSCDESDALQILETISCYLKESVLIATYGSSGSCMLSNGEKHFYRSDHPDGRDIMGAGAFFSAYYISAFCETKHVVLAHSYACQETSRLCQNSTNILLQSLSEVGK